MDLVILARVVPALLAATTVTWAAGRPWQLRPGQALDEVLRAGFIGLVTARLAWIALAGPDVWRTMGATALLLRAGVETWVGVGAAALWIGWRTDEPTERALLLTAAPAAALAGAAVWHATCGLDGVCAGTPASWGVSLPGYVSRVVPVGYIEAGVAAVLATVAWQRRDHRPSAVATAAAYAAARALLAWWKAPLVALPTTDQVLSATAAVALGTVALRLRHRARSGSA